MGLLLEIAKVALNASIPAKPPETPSLGRSPHSLGLTRVPPNEGSTGLQLADPRNQASLLEPKTPRLGRGICPGCMQSINECGHRWGQSPVCRSCYEVAAANPSGYGLTLGRACRWNCMDEPN